MKRPLVNGTGSCALPYPTGSDENFILKDRIGSVAGFIDDHLVVCGGYSPEEKTYLDLCQSQSGRDCHKKMTQASR